MNYFKVDSTLLTDSDVGKYEITVTAIIVADKYLRKEFYNSFILTIHPGLKPERPQKEKNPKAIAFKDWKGPVYESIKEAPFDRASPIPYVFDLSVNGILKIGWDTKMIRLLNDTAIKETKVAIKEWKNQTEYARRKLHNSGEVILLTNETTYIAEEFMVFDSLEVILTTNDDQKQAI